MKSSFGTELIKIDGMKKSSGKRRRQFYKAILPFPIEELYGAAIKMVSLTL